jgi:hypothetical protein
MIELAEPSPLPSSSSSPSAFSDLFYKKVDVMAILHGSTGMISSGSGCSVDVSKTNALLKHLNIGSKQVLSPCSSFERFAF